MPTSQAPTRSTLTRAPVSSASHPGALAGRLGLSVPREWWPSAPMLKSYEAAGFAWVQLHSPPISVLREPKLSIRHAAAAAEALGTTGLRSVIHAPSGLRAGSRAADSAFENLLSYAAEVGSDAVVYHALALPDSAEHVEALGAETISLRRLASLAERLEVTIALENLAPLYPGPETLSASPLSLRGLVGRIGSERVGLCLDVGHAHVIADLRHTRVDLLCDPVVDTVVLFHLHDNFGARRRATGRELGVDPLRLDLHLPPGRGTLPWERITPLLGRHRAPLLLEVHPPHRPRASTLASHAAALLG